MNIQPKSVFGAIAEVDIEFDGTLEQLANTLESVLNLKSFLVERSESPPHDEIGSAEAMGWELWLEKISSPAPFRFRLRMETEHALQESVQGRMHDLSPWLARLISTLCSVRTDIS